MKMKRPLSLMVLASAFGALGGTEAAAQAPAPPPLEARIARYNPDSVQMLNSVHAGSGPMGFTSLLSPSDLDTNLYFLHRGIIPPGGGIGHHFHNTGEEMFVILDGAAEFTINGRTSVLEGPAGAPVTMGSSHAIRNHTDQTIEWMNINVSSVRNEYDAFDLNDGRVGVVIDPIPVFMTMRLDRALLQAQPLMFGGTGTVQYRRALGPTVFRTPWAYVDHLVVPPGASVGSHQHRGVAEFYYVMNGEGTITVRNETATIRSGDAVPIRLNEAHGVSNSGSQPLELMIVGIARDMTKDLTTTASGGGGPR